ncbi:MAG: hypothetical protein KDC27_19390 [Acidobacteria bacterium]|nr:hypothetical protein [Acidobacteriota bacterium]
MANPFDYKFIEPLTSSADVRGSAVFCRFVCPVTGRSVSASQEITAAPPAPISQQPQDGILAGLRRSLAATLQGVLGSSQYAEAFSETIPDADLTADENARRRAVVGAFRSVSSLFRWDSAAQRWVALEAGKDVSTAFERRLRVHPLHDTPDMGLLLRMLVAVASSDGQLDAEERLFFGMFAAASGASLDELLGQEPPSTADLSAMDPARRESALMLCWAAALCDSSLSTTEAVMVEEMAQGLGISQEKTAELKRDAQNYLLEKVLEEAFHDFKMSIEEEDRVVQVGRRLGLRLADTQKAILSFRERRGLA